MNTPPQTSGSMEPEPHTPPQAAVLAEFPTPTVPNNATGQNYVSDHIGRDENYQILSKEISGKVLGPMPPQEFLKKFLPVAEPAASVINLTQLQTMTDANTEVAMYEPFVSLINS
jgi:hypothetical protein